MRGNRVEIFKMLNCKLSIVLAAICLNYTATAPAQPPISTDWSTPASFQNTVTFGVDPHLANNGDQWITVYSARETSTSDYDIMLSRSTDGHNWTAPQPLNQDWNTDSIDDRDAKITFGDNGIWVCIWQRENAVIYSRSTDNGLTWADPQIVATDVFAPSITFVGSSTFLIAASHNKVWRFVKVFRSQDDGTTWTDLNVRSSVPCVNDSCYHEFTNPVISSLPGSPLVILRVYLNTIYYTPGSPGISGYYGLILDSNVSIPLFDKWQRDINYILGNVVEAASLTEFFKVFNKNFSGLQIPYDHPMPAFSHPASSVLNSERVAVSKMGHWMGISVTRDGGATSNLVATLSINSGNSWRPTHLVDTASVAAYGLIKQAELKSSPQGQFITVFQLDNTAGESTLWYSSFDQLVLDSDTDGVSDFEDMCPNTPPGVAVDAVGCDNPDVDGDGVLNVNDQCPDTPEGDVVNEHGCSVDLDGDGVLNENDLCPDTPEGDVVDEHGCTTTDRDLDGVLNENDQCPDTPEGDVVDANGCSILQNCPCEGPRAGGIYKNNRAYLKCLKQQSKQYVKESRLTKKARKTLLKQYKKAPCVPAATE